MDDLRKDMTNRFGDKVRKRIKEESIYLSLKIFHDDL